MTPEYWKQRWQAQQIGFHLQQVNPALIKFLPTLNLKKSDSCLIPLCGKSHDIRYLAKYFNTVIGIELSALAVDAFFAESNQTATLINDQYFNIYRHAGISIFCGDFFQFSAAQCPSIDLIYDRAALVALPENMRTALYRALQNIF